jgi:hypothetical protein
MNQTRKYTLHYSEVCTEFYFSLHPNKRNWCVDQGFAASHLYNTRARSVASIYGDEKAIIICDEVCKLHACLGGGVAITVNQDLVVDQCGASRTMVINDLICLKWPTSNT